MRKVEIKITEGLGESKDKIHGLGLILDELDEEKQIDNLELLFASVLLHLYEWKYQLEITERE